MREKLRKCLREVLADNTDVVLACRKMLALSNAVQDIRDPDWLLFVGFESETDTWLRGKDRALWTPDALSKQDAEFGPYLRGHLPALRDSASRLLSKLSSQANPEPSDIMELVCDVPEKSLQAGTRGSLVRAVQASPAVYLVRFPVQGEPSCSVSLPGEKLSNCAVDDWDPAVPIPLHSMLGILEDLPSYDLRRGMVGRLVQVITEPKLAYLVEFRDVDGSLHAIELLTPEQVLVKCVPRDEALAL